MPKELDSEHIHEYVRCVKLDGKVDKNRYRCAHPDCHHWMYRNLLKGKRSICAVCHVREILLDYENLRRAKPVCFHCSGSKKSAAVKEKFDVFKEMFKEDQIQPGETSSAIDTGAGIFFTGEAGGGGE